MSKTVFYDPVKEAMEVKTYRAETMHEALSMVQHDLGADAAVLHTREVQSRWLFGLLTGPRQIEVTASRGVHVPSRLPARSNYSSDSSIDDGLVLGQDHFPSRSMVDSASAATIARETIPRNTLPHNMENQLTELQTMVKELCKRSDEPGQQELPEELFRLFTDLLDSDLNEDLARELVERVRSESHGARLTDMMLAKARIAHMIEAEIRSSGPIVVTPGLCRLVALVGPTGVGKTTTIAKLAAHYRLKEKLRVGLITVDTYRIAAVEQLRTYADIIDLPMQVVSTPREMREAVTRMNDLDLILLDTAGRSPKDEVRIQELRAFLSEAQAHEVHLVLSSVASARVLEQTAERFAAVGTTALILTKLDEASGLGNLLQLVRASRLPVSYLTNGQNVPDDIETAEPSRMARLILGMEKRA